VSFTANAPWNRARMKARSRVVQAAAAAQRPFVVAGGRITTGDDVPKQKTHSGAKDRFRVTRTGKVLHRKMNKNHMLEKKTAARKRRLSGMSELTGGDAAQVRKLLRGN